MIIKDNLLFYCLDCFLKFMVELQAGINEEHLTLALEAEAASIYLESGLSRRDPDSQNNLMTGMPYLVVDLGG